MDLLIVFGIGYAGETHIIGLVPKFVVRESVELLEIEIGCRASIGLLETKRYYSSWNCVGGGNNVDTGDVMLRSAYGKIVSWNLTSMLTKSFLDWMSSTL